MDNEDRKAFNQPVTSPGLERMEDREYQVGDRSFKLYRKFKLSPEEIKFLRARVLYLKHKIEMMQNHIRPFQNELEVVVTMLARHESTKD